MALIIEKFDPISLAQSRHTGSVRLTIGEEGKRGSRYSLLSPTEARMLGYALLLEAERCILEKSPRGKSN